MLPLILWLQGELEQSGDMFCDDIFGESPAGGRRMVCCFFITVLYSLFNMRCSVLVYLFSVDNVNKCLCPLQGKGDGLAINSSGLNDNWDDPEGRYCE